DGRRHRQEPRAAEGVRRPPLGRQRRRRRHRRLGDLLVPVPRHARLDAARPARRPWPRARRARGVVHGVERAHGSGRANRPGHRPPLSGRNVAAAALHCERDLLRRPAGARGGAVRETRRVLQGQSERAGDHRSPHGPRPAPGARRGRRAGETPDARPSPAARPRHVSAHGRARALGSTGGTSIGCDGSRDVRVDRALASARAAFEDWRLVPAPDRGNILFRFAELLRAHKAELTDLMTREMGKVKAEAGGDVQEAIDMSYYMGGEGRRLFGQTTPSELRDKFMMSVRMPVGVVGAITPWNFPIAIPAWKLCPALVCGNTVVLKPAEDTPLLAERFVELLAEAGLPDGVVTVVQGLGEEAGDALVRHPDVPVISFTGARETGALVAKAAADRLKHVHLELGGKNAIVVMDDADLELAVEGIVWSAFGTSGQRCTAASRVIVHRKVYEPLAARLVAAAERLRLGPGWEDETDVGPLINRAA